MTLDHRFRMARRPALSLTAFAALFCVWLPNAGAYAKDVSVVRAPDSLVVIPPQRPAEAIALIEPPEGNDRDLPWRFAQWNNPHAIGQPKSTCENGSVAYQAQSASGSFKLLTGAKCGKAANDQAPSEAQTAFSIMQSGGELACERRSRPLEYSSNFAPQRRSIATEIRRTPLAELVSLHHTVALTVQRDEQAGGSPCRRNGGGALSALVFNNPSKGQTLFYHLALHDSGEARLRPPSWWATGNQGVGGWRSTTGHQRFGFRDPISSFGMTASGTQIRFDTDLLPRIKQAIREGASLGMDQDLNNWRFGSVYFGQHIWGRRTLATTWSQYALKATTK